MSPRRRLARLAGAVLAGFAVVPVPAAPAAAHGADTPAGTNYRAEVRAVTPALDGLTVRVVEAGARLELVNRSGRTVEVLGYAGEPYLEIRPDGVYENLRSPATYLNETLSFDTRPPADADPTSPPRWRRTGTGPVVRWHDQRALWLEDRPPAPVRAEPDRQHRVRDWVIPLRVDLTAGEIRGTLDWVPPPDPVLWWVLSFAGALLIGALGLPTAGSQAGRAALRTLAGLAVLGGTAAVVLAVARQLGTGPEGPVALLTGLLSGQVWPLLAGLGAIAAGGYALARRSAADFGLALSGACLALFAGLADGVVFSRSIVPVAWPAVWVRVLVASALVIGTGLVIAGTLRLRAAGQAARLAATADQGSGESARSGRSGLIPSRADSPDPTGPAQPDRSAREPAQPGRST